MSEELRQRGYAREGDVFGAYERYNIGSTTLNQLEKYKIIPKIGKTPHRKSRLDELLVARAKDADVGIDVILVVEHKRPGSFDTNTKRKKAIEQCNNVCQILNAKIGIATDGKNTIWFNPNQKTHVNKYTDKVDKTKRSYTIIHNSDNIPLTTNFVLDNPKHGKQLNDDTEQTLKIIDRVIKETDSKNSTLRPVETVDPINLAKSVWQDIYVNTGKDPTKCLYNVIELFIFKFLSDLKILKKTHGFEFLIQMVNGGAAPVDVLNHYANISRKQIRKLFPESRSDGTTIINGTIFINQNGEAENTQASLFVSSIRKYEKFGTLKNIDKDFKTKLFETFLKESGNKRKLGQFLTPRKVIGSIVSMAEVNKLHPKSRVCDPFCGVGGFICEILHYDERKNDFIPKNKKITPDVDYRGYDRALDDDDARIIILAKANMLIYLSDVLADHPALITRFSDVFNTIFELKSNNMGTLGISEQQSFDLILTNPPYVTQGSKTIKSLISENPNLEFYDQNGKGIESLSLQWIIRNLNKRGRAFVIVPTTLLAHDKVIRKLILKECFLDGLVFLPSKTFYGTPQKTCIVCITKKSSEQKQLNNVFTYTVSNIGETLDVNRFDTGDANDLTKMADLFKMYVTSPKTFMDTQNDKKMKLINIKDFTADQSWDILDLWTDNEQILSGITKETEALNLALLRKTLSDITDTSDNLLDKLENKQRHKHNTESYKFKDIFKTKKGKSVYTKQYVNKHSGEYPVYSAKTTGDRLLGKTNVYDHDIECLQITTNGAGAGSLFHLKRHKFSINADAMLIIRTNDDVFYPYALLALERAIKSKGFSWEKKIKIDSLDDILIDIPVNESGDLDIDTQKEIALEYNSTRTEISNLSKLVSNIIDQQLLLGDLER
ncbi:MAG: N-6 DNA methylase [Alphaproteobacteria bacterium]|nr:N-6 DNA methylase [Alphaproteobacteria bacterium]MDA8030197.1 N-6 DNA methylase [Alphaproteobacteria bacterium]